MAAGYKSFSRIGSRSTIFALEVDTRVLDRLPEAFRRQVRQAVQKTALDIEAETKLTIRAKNLIDTGNLLNSIVTSSSLDGYTAWVDVFAYYGIYLEFGTVKMAARPFLGPSVEKLAPEFVEAIMQAMENALNESAA